MAIADHIPLAKAGRTKRNIAVAALYLVLLPFILFIVPFYLLFAIGTNRNGMGDAVAESPLGFIPGVGGGGWSAAIVVFVMTIVVLGAFGAAMPNADTDEGAEADLEGDSNELEDTNDADDSSSNDDDGTDSTGDGDTNTDSSSSDGTDTAGEDGTSTDSSSSDDGTDTTGGDETTESSEPQLTELQSIRAVDDRYDPYSTTFDGSGQEVTDEVGLNGGATVFIFEHNGESNFVVELINAETGESKELLVNEIGTIDGATAVPLEPGDYYLNVDADGDWSVEIAEPLPPDEDVHEIPVEAFGEGKDVIGPVNFDGRVTIAGEHNGESNFIVELIDEVAMSSYERELVFNEIGEFEGETSVTYNGVSWIVVDADGEWTIEIE